MRTESREIILNVLKEMEADELVGVWNEYCSAINCMDDYISRMEELDTFYEGYTPLEIAHQIHCGHDEYDSLSEFNPNRAYFYTNGYANPVSIDWVTWIPALDKWSDSPVGNAIDELVDYIIENEDSLCNTALDDALREIEELEESEDEEA